MIECDYVSDCICDAASLLCILICLESQKQRELFTYLFCVSAFFPYVLVLLSFPGDPLRISAKPLLKNKNSDDDGSSTPRDRTSSNVVKREKSSPKTEAEKKHQALLEQYQAKQMLTLAAHNILPNLGEKYDEKLRILNVHMAILATTILALLLLYIDVCFDKDTLVFDDSYSTCPAAFWCKSVSWGLYMLFLERLICYYSIKSESHMNKWGFNTRLQVSQCGSNFVG